MSNKFSNKKKIQNSKTKTKKKKKREKRKENVFFTLINTFLKSSKKTIKCLFHKAPLQCHLYWYFGHSKKRVPERAFNTNVWLVYSNQGRQNLRLRLPENKKVYLTNHFREWKDVFSMSNGNRTSLVNICGGQLHFQLENYKLHCRNKIHW